MSKNEKTSTDQSTFAPLKVSDVALLTTYRRNGQGVDTPVGIRTIGEKAYFTTPSTTSKVKRLANNPHVTLAPFTKMGMKVIGPSVEGLARRLDEEEASAIFGDKSTLWGRMWSLIYKLQNKQELHYEVLPSPDADPSM